MSAALAVERAAVVVASQKTLPAALALLGLLATSGVYCTRTAFSAFFPVPVTDFPGVSFSRAAGPVAVWHIVGRASGASDAGC